MAQTYDSGAVMSVVKCTGPGTTIPISASLPPASAVVKNDPSQQSKQAMSNLQSYNQVYSCTVVVLQKKPQPKAGCAAAAARHPGTVARDGQSPVASVALACRPHRRRAPKLNTGFGGEAGQVARHHPA